MTRRKKTVSTALVLGNTRIGGKTTEVIVRRKPKKRRSRRRRQQQPNMSNQNATANLTSYTNTLNDPFMYPPIKMGFGCMVDTGLATAYLKQTFTVNADGSFAIALQPTIGPGVSNKGYNYNIGGISSTTWTAVPFANESAIGTLATEARIVSYGLRVLPLQALTAAPGILYAGHVNSCSQGSLFISTPTSLANFTSSHMGLGTNGCLVTGRPQDSSGFQFGISTLFNNNTTLSYNSQTLYVSGTGFPANTTIFSEVVLNVEYITGLSDNYTNAIIDGAQEMPGANQTNTLASSFSSVERLWAAAKTYLHPGAIMSASLEYINGGSTADIVGAGLRAFNNHSAHNRTPLQRDRNNNLFMVEEAD